MQTQDNSTSQSASDSSPTKDKRDEDVQHHASDSGSDLEPSNIPSSDSSSLKRSIDAAESKSETPTSSKKLRLETTPEKPSGSVPEKSAQPEVKKASPSVPKSLPAIERAPAQNVSSVLDRVMTPQLSAQLISALPYQASNKQLLRNSEEYFMYPYLMKPGSPSVMTYNPYSLPYYPSVPVGVNPLYSDSLYAQPAYGSVPNAAYYGVEGAGAVKYPASYYPPVPNQDLHPLSRVVPTMPVVKPTPPSVSNALLDVKEKIGGLATTTAPTKANPINFTMCNCKKSKCLKLYCLCFSRNIFCNEHCQCTNCHNTLVYTKEREKIVSNILRKDPYTFKTVVGSNGNMVSSRQSGCRCKRTECLKKYCECYAQGIPCGSHCSCVGCKNNGS